MTATELSGADAQAISSRYRQLLHRRLLLAAAIVLAIAAALLCDITLGPSGMPFHQLWLGIFDPGQVSPGVRTIGREIRPDGGAGGYGAGHRVWHRYSWSQRGLVYSG